jgi:Intracellular proteinase inhibitor
MQGNRSLAVALDARPAPLRAGGEVSWRLTVSNHAAEDNSLTFPTAQLGDVILEREGSEHHRWSDGRLFAQVVTEQRLEPGATWTVMLDDTLDVEPGAYEAVGIVTCIPPPPPVRVHVAVGANS